MYIFNKNIQLEKAGTEWIFIRNLVSRLAFFSTPIQVNIEQVFISLLVNQLVNF